MKKNLQLALAIMLGLATTTVTAQDWSVDSETRMTNMSDDNNEVNGMTEQFMRMGVSWGGDDVSVHASFNGYASMDNWDGQDPAFGLDIHEMYASTDVMGFASLSAGRMALEYGSGRVIGSNDWNNNGNTFDGFMIDMENDFADISLGFARYSDDLEGYEELSDNWMLLNASKDMGNMSFNFTYGSNDFSEGSYDLGQTVMALEGSYDLDMGATLMFGYYSASETETGYDDFDMGLTTIGASYEVMDGLSLHGAYEMYDENGFWLATGNQLGYGQGTGAFNIDMEGTQMVFGADYDMGDFGFGVSMYNFESEEMNGVTIESEAMDFSASYAFNENASLGLKYSTTTLGAADDVTGEAVSEDMPDMMWMSLNVSF